VINVFLLDYYTRLREWFKLKESLAEQDLSTICIEVDRFWQRVPINNHYLHPDDIEDWPNPWELVYNNVYCDLSICLGMTYTLCLLESPTFTDIELKIYRTESGWTNLSLINQGKYVLNYHYGRVVNSQCVSEDKMKLAYSYSKFDLLDKFS
jgi:hypothetical protein